MKIQEVISYLESIAPLDYQENYDNSGLIIGNLEMKLTSTLICLDSVEEVIDEAIEKGCNLVIAHHPIIFSGLKKINGKNHVERSIIKAIKNDIAIYAMHTNLDNIQGGVSSKIADLLGLKNQKIMAPKKGVLRKLEVYCPKDSVEKIRQSLFKVGAGSIGHYNNCSFLSNGQGTFLPTKNSNPLIGEIGKEERVDEIKLEIIFPKHLEDIVLNEMRLSHPYEEIAYQIYILENSFQSIGSGIFGELNKEISPLEFLGKIKHKMKTDSLKHTNIVKESIKKVAVCGGSGSFLINNAKILGVDMFISADFKYHDFFNAENDIIIVDIGHYESEQFTKELIYDLLVNNFPKFAFQLSKINTNPINYL